MLPHGSRRLLPVLASSAFLAAGLSAQEREPTGEPPDRPAPDEHAYADDPDNAFEFALSGDGLWFAYRTGLHRRHGYTSFELFAGEDDDFAADVRLMRFGEPSRREPLGLGIGLGLFGAAVDDTDDELLAITLTGAVDYALGEALELDYPLRLGVETSYAPDAATFADGKRVLDVLARVEIDLSSWATAFAGYRHLEVDLEDEDDPELDSALQAGVRLGF